MQFLFISCYFTFIFLPPAAVHICGSKRPGALRVVPSLSRRNSRSPSACLTRVASSWWREVGDYLPRETFIAPCIRLAGTFRSRRASGGGLCTWEEGGGGRQKCHEVTVRGWSDVNDRAWRIAMESVIDSFVGVRQDGELSRARNILENFLQTYKPLKAFFFKLTSE